MEKFKSKENMDDIEFLRVMKEISDKQKELDEFHNIAEKYGMCTPWCYLENPCADCNK